MLYIVLVVVVQLRDSAARIDISPPFGPPLLLPQPSRSQSTGLRPCVSAAVSFQLSVLRMVVQVNVLSICPTLSFPHGVHKSVLYGLCLFLPCK